MCLDVQSGAKRIKQKGDTLKELINSFLSEIFYIAPQILTQSQKTLIPKIILSSYDFIRKTTYQFITHTFNTKL
jgi:hypothetical protein